MLVADELGPEREGAREPDAFTATTSVSGQLLDSGEERSTSMTKTLFGEVGFASLHRIISSGIHLKGRFL